MATQASHITTADQLLAAADDLGPCELVRGELTMMTPAGFEHGDVEANLVAALKVWNQAYAAGRIVPGDTGFLLERNPDTVRCPDVAFVRHDRIPEVLPQGFFPGPPDLAIEIRSPNDKQKDIHAKIDDYLRLGVQVVWDVDPAAKTVIIHRADQDPKAYSADGTLSEPDLLPNLSLPVAEIFAK